MLRHLVIYFKAINMDKNESSVKRLTIMYISALSLVALLTIVGQFFVQRSLDGHIHDAKIINLAGRQRFQSQSIVKNILILTDTTHHLSDSARLVYQTRLESLLKTWQHYHVGLKNGYLPEFEYYARNSDVVKKYFEDIEEHFDTVYSSAMTIKFLGNKNLLKNYQEVTKFRKLILDNEYLFLQLMDKIVYQLSKESEEKVRKLEIAEKILMFFTIVILIMEGVFIFRPAVKQIKQYVVMLLKTQVELQILNEELSETNAKLTKAQDELLIAQKEKYQRRIEEQLIRSASLIKGQEEERKRLSKELHDGLGQLLTALKFDLEKVDLEKSDFVKNKTILMEAKKLLSQTINETRNIAFNLMPSILNDFGIVPTIRLVGEQIRTKSGVDVVFKTNIEDDHRYNQDTEIALYRIIQEATNNILKHADATRIIVELNQDDSKLHLRLSDNGKGFNMKQVKRNKENHSGLNNMEERVKLLDGNFHIDSKKGDGVLIEVNLPI